MRKKTNVALMNDEYLIRLSVGIEDYNDIEADIIQALENSKVGVIS